jgi:hypothetical protein
MIPQSQSISGSKDLSLVTEGMIDSERSWGGLVIQEESQRLGCLRNECKLNTSDYMR